MKTENNESVLLVTHGDPVKPLMFGDIAVPCFVLEDGRRVLTMNGMIAVLGMQKRGGEGGGAELNRLARFARGNAVHQHVSGVVTNSLNRPILFRFPSTGLTAYGFEATTLVDLCDAVIAAWQSGSLKSTQTHIAMQALMVMRTVAKLGIVALVDEKTGYQQVRPNDALQKLLDAFLSKEHSKWAKRFPDEFYEQIFRLRGWKWNGRSANCPQCVAQYTRDLIYERLAPGVMEELEKLNPVTPSGSRGVCHHQHLTESVGHPALDSHLKQVVLLMQITDSWSHFKRTLNLAFPKKPHQASRALFN